MDATIEDVRACLVCDAHFVATLGHVVTCSPECATERRRSKHLEITRPKSGRLGGGDRSRQPWTDEERAKLAREYFIYGAAAMAKRLGRSTESIRGAVAELRGRGLLPRDRLNGSHQAPNRKDWSAIHVSQARALWELGVPAADIGRRVGRSNDAVSAKARAERWARPERLNKVDVARILGVTDGMVRWWARRGWIAFPHPHLRGGHGGAMIAPEELEAWLADPRSTGLWDVNDVRADWRERAERLRPGYVMVPRPKGDRHFASRVNSGIATGAVPAIRNFRGHYAIAAAELPRVVRIYGRAG